jgi:hypothetical protein
LGKFAFITRSNQRIKKIKKRLYKKAFLLGITSVLSCMDAPENARVLERNKRIRIAVMYPACLRGLVTAGLDGIRLC